MSKVRIFTVPFLVTFCGFLAGYFLGFNQIFVNEHFGIEQEYKILVYGDLDLEPIHKVEKPLHVSVRLQKASTVEEFLDLWQKTDLAIVSWSVIRNRELGHQKFCQSQKVEEIWKNDVSVDFKLSQLQERGILPLFWKADSPSIELMVVLCPEKTNDAEEKSDQLISYLFESTRLLKILESGTWGITLTSFENSQLAENQKPSHLRQLVLSELKF